MAEFRCQRCQLATDEKKASKFAAGFCSDCSAEMVRQDCPSASLSIHQGPPSENWDEIEKIVEEMTERNQEYHDILLRIEKFVGLVSGTRPELQPNPEAISAMVGASMSTVKILSARDVVPDELKPETVRRAEERKQMGHQSHPPS